MKMGLPEDQCKTKARGGGGTKQTLKSVRHLCSHTVHTCREYSGNIAGPGKCWSGAWLILQGHTHTHSLTHSSLPRPRLLTRPPSCAACGHSLRRQGCTTAHKKPPLHKLDHTEKKKKVGVRPGGGATQPAIRNEFKEKK